MPRIAAGGTTVTERGENFFRYIACATGIALSVAMTAAAERPA